MEQQGFERPDNKTFYGNLLKGIEISRQGFSTTQSSFFRVRDSHLPPEITPNSGKNATWKLMMPTTTPPHIMP